MIFTIAAIQQATIDKVSWISLAIGLIFGFLAQRSRMCFIGGWRDFFLVKDTYLLKGFIAFFASATIFFFVFYMAGYKGTMLEYPRFLQPSPEYTAEYIVAHFPVNDELNTYDVSFKDMTICSVSMSGWILRPGESVVMPVKGIHIFGVIIPNELILALLAALGIGLFSTFANGCPIRQHVMASSGNASAMFYLLGFYVAIVVYDKFLVKYINSFINYYVQWGPGV